VVAIGPLALVGAPHGGIRGGRLELRGELLVVQDRPLCIVGCFLLHDVLSLLGIPPVCSA